MEAMYKCAVAVCPGGTVRKETFDDAYLINGKHVLVYGIPVTVCANCGELTFSVDDIEKASAMLFDDEQKPRQVTIPAFEFARLEPTTKDLLLAASD